MADAQSQQLCTLPHELRSTLRAALLSRGISALTPVQTRTLQPAREARDLSVCSPTGSGKTLAYVLPLADAHLARRDGDGGDATAADVSVLVLLPTRELAAQVHAAAAFVTQAAGVRAVLCAGGAPLALHEAALRDADAPPHWVVGTPGRLKDLADRGVLRLHALRTQVCTRVRACILCPSETTRRLRLRRSWTRRTACWTRALATRRWRCCARPARRKR